MKQTSPGKPVARRILIAGIGNIFFGDDGFGVEVAQRLARRQTRRYPEHVEVVDFGIRGMDLAYTLLEDYDTLILIDALPRAGAPGTLYLIEPDIAHIGQQQGVEAGRAAVDSHSMDPVKVLAFARTLGARPLRTLLVGCIPASIGDDDMQMGLSEPVQAALDSAIAMIDSLVEELAFPQG